MKKRQEHLLPQIIRTRLAVFTILFSFFIQFSALAFGTNGHRIVARIAELHLEPSTKQALKQIFDDNKMPASLVKLATWPDEIKTDIVL